MSVTKRSATVRWRMITDIRVFRSLEVTSVKNTVTFPTAEMAKRMTMATTEGRMRSMYSSPTTADCDSVSLVTPANGVGGEVGVNEGVVWGVMARRRGSTAGGVLS